MALTWIQALKKWNEKNENWCVPRKDTEGYNEVMALMKGETPKKVKKEKEKIKKEKKKKEKTKKEKTNEQVEPEIKTREVAAEEKQDSSKKYLERISAKYEVPEKRIKEADEYVRKHFIDSGFAKYYRAAHSAPVSMITKSGTKNNPHSDRKFVNEYTAQNNSEIEKGKRIVKPYEKAFIQTMLNPVLCEIFCNIVVDTHLADIMYINEKFRHTFALVYGLGNVYVDTPHDREKIKNIVKSDSNAEYIKQQAAKNARRS
jgi:hypothetical protein